MKLSPEVLIYIQTVKNYFETNNEAKIYFISNMDEESFFQKLGEISQKNFEKDGEVMLTKTQFELLRNSKSIQDDIDKLVESKFVDTAFMNIGDYGKICLN